MNIKSMIAIPAVVVALAATTAFADGNETIVVKDGDCLSCDGTFTVGEDGGDLSVSDCNVRVFVNGKESTRSSGGKVIKNGKVVSSWGDEGIDDETRAKINKLLEENGISGVLVDGSGMFRVDSQGGRKCAKPIGKSCFVKRQIQKGGCVKDKAECKAAMQKAAHDKAKAERAARKEMRDKRLDLDKAKAERAARRAERQKKIDNLSAQLEAMQKTLEELKKSE